MKSRNFKSILLAVMLIFSINAFSQNVIIDKRGNYITTSKTSVPETNTGKTYTDSKGNVYPVFVTKKGKLYVIKVSKKTNKEYRYYLKP